MSVCVCAYAGDLNMSVVQQSSLCLLMEVCLFIHIVQIVFFSSVLWHCCLGDRKGIRPVKKTWCWFVGGNDLKLFTGALTTTPCFIKTTPYLIVHNFGKCWLILKNFHPRTQQRLCNELIIKGPSHLKGVDTLPCEMWMSGNYWQSETNVSFNNKF